MLASRLSRSPVLQRQRDLRRQTHEARRCTAGLDRTSVSLHQLSVTRQSADPIAAGHRALQAHDCQVAMIAVAASSISGGANLQPLRRWADGPTASIYPSLSVFRRLFSVNLDPGNLPSGEPMPGRSRYRPLRSINSLARVGWQRDLRGEPHGGYLCLVMLVVIVALM